jgi:hypothetical protein
MKYPSKPNKNIRSTLYHSYKYNIFPKIENIRGATRLLKVLEYLAQLGIGKINEKNIELISEKEWDNLIIIDAARHDTYQETINPDSDSRITAESHSRGFIRENFSKGDWSDTVVITANPFYNEEEFEKLTGEKPGEKFETIFQVWSTDWNTEHGTVMPDKIVEKTKTAEKLFPEKKKIIHLMQPHHPFIKSNIDDPGFGDTKGNQKNYEKAWELAEKGKIEHKKILKGYLKNHSLLSEHFSQLEEILEGSTKITADHGNLLGENSLYGHPGNSNLKPLKKVPWDSLKNI